jgi:peroxiredoxin
MPGDQALDFQLADLEGKNASLSAWRSRPVVLNFWASWCGPCQKEASEFSAFHERFRDRGVAVLGVDVREDAQAVREFANRYGLSYPLLLDADGSVSTAYQVRGIPTTLVLDGAGVIRVRHVGPLNADQLAAYVEPYLPAENAATPAARGGAVSRAPDCALPKDTGEIVRLSDYRDKQSIVLVFYRGQT